MSITDQLDTRLRATNVVKLGMKRGSVGTSTRSNTSRPTSQPYRVGCTVQVGRLSDDAKAKNEDYLELKSGEKIKVVRNSACLSNENRSVCLLRPEKWMKM